MYVSFIRYRNGDTKNKCNLEHTDSSNTLACQWESEVTQGHKAK
jgi:hypothetical protein